MAAALYLLLVPHLIAGPIIRYCDIAAHLTTRATGSAELAYSARRFIVGLPKKMLVASIVAGAATSRRRTPTGFGALTMTCDRKPRSTVGIGRHLPG